MARSRAATLLPSRDAELREIENWYRDELARSAPPVGLKWRPVLIGPTWRYEHGAWVLPELTLGWGVLAWCGYWLRDKRGQPWQFTLEQARFVLWYYAIDPEGFWLNHSAILQRLKGWGKDPLAACVSMAALCGPVAFDRFDGDRPVGRDEPNAWVQCVAVSQEQTQNTMKLFPSLVPAETRREFGIQVGKLNVWAMGDSRQVQAITNNPLSVEGGRATLVIPNEIQNWNASNSGPDMWGAIEGNAAKSEDGAARMLAICNAFRPGDESVGEKQREAWESTQLEVDAAVEYGVMYDSVEAPPEAPLTAEDAPDVLDAVRGDATWLSTRRIVASIMNPSNAASESRRKWYNQVVSQADARFDALAIGRCEVDERINDGEQVVIFGDGSKSDDATGLVAVNKAGLAQVLHVQQPKKGQIVDRMALEVDLAAAFARFRVVGLWFDPSHLKDDAAAGDERFWWPMCDQWAKDHGRRLKLWAVKGGDRQHAVAWDMSTPTHQALFTAAVEQLDTDITEGTFRFAKSGWLRQHLTAAKAAPNKFGVSMRKDNRESRKKIDLAVCAAGARMMWRSWLLSEIGTGKGTPSDGSVIVMG